MIIRKGIKGTSYRSRSKDLWWDVSSGLCKYSLTRADVSCFPCCAPKRDNKKNILSCQHKKAEAYVTRKCPKTFVQMSV